MQASINPARWDADLCDDVLARMAGAGIHISPTLVVADYYIENWPVADAPNMQMIPATIRAAWDKPDFRLDAVTEEVVTHAECTIAMDREPFRIAIAVGGLVLASTDDRAPPACRHLWWCAFGPRPP